MSDRIKVMTISDHPLLPSGVGTQTKYMIEALLKSGKFEVFSLGGAIKHPNYNLMKKEEHWHILPVDGYGDKQQILGLINQVKPDMLWFMTDPRYYEWLWMFEEDIRQNIPMIYYHVWDNYPLPMYNKKFYDSNDVIVTISKVTSDIVQNVSPDVHEVYLPHAVPVDIFRKISASERADVLKNNKALKDKFIVFWNNRNARRKQSGTLIHWFSEFLKQDHIDQDSACLIMHTKPDDPHGQPLEYLAEHYGLVNSEVIFSKEGLPAEDLAKLYGIADCTVNIADAEGFGLSTLESLASETPIIATLTGGLQEQLTDGENWFGIGLKPASKALIGSQQVPYIYEDRVSKEDFISALNEIYAMSPKKREELGQQGREHVMKNYNFDNYGTSWVNLLQEIHEKYGSWGNRKNYQAWRMTEL